MNAQSAALTAATGSEPTLKYVQANGVRFAYLEQGSGPLVMFMHGFPDNAWSYRKQLQVFADAGYRAVSPFLREGSMALGATRWETIWKVVLPTAKSGLAVAVILGIARAIGETLAVQMVIGNSAVIPTSLFSATAALPTEIVIDMAGAGQGSPLQHALFSMAFLLLLIAMLLILGVKLALRKS